ncbi:Hypp2996 [Branchiostoma lanceolatum]|uniref:Hypp2996 protein n=1 Tax=Branchiostoma lanceolatum TaxID=7740 RepID=A0A8J9ZVN6_BRALA|nr:Hypp2996 [Branchiostoma lanceolatum]
MTSYSGIRSVLGSSVRRSPIFGIARPPCFEDQDGGVHQSVFLQSQTCPERIQRHRTEQRRRRIHPDIVKRRRPARRDPGGGRTSSETSSSRTRNVFNGQKTCEKGGGGPAWQQDMCLKALGRSLKTRLKDKQQSWWDPDDISTGGWLPLLDHPCGLWCWST